jgi:hypothetical protein
MSLSGAEDTGARPGRRSGEPLGEGSVTAAHRVGATAPRATWLWTPAVPSLLGYLAAHGCTAPRVLGVDGQGCGVLSYLEGGIATRPRPDVLRSGDGLIQVGRTLRDYHDAVAGFRPPSGAVWRTPGAPAKGEVIRHGDLGPWNSAWRQNRLVGLIDWDFAEPGSRLQDAAQAGTSRSCGPTRTAARPDSRGRPTAPSGCARFATPTAASPARRLSTTWSG